MFFYKIERKSSISRRTLICRAATTIANGSKEYIFVYILNNTITLFKTSIPFVRIHLIDDNTNPVRLSEFYSIVAERGDDFGEHLVFFL